jgi:hypothetical protein
MKLLSRTLKALLLGIVLPLLMQAPAYAQQQQKPVMENVFYNVVWGSVLGATIGLAGAIIASPDKSSPTNVRESVFTGATGGGLIGLGLALYLVYQGITFDPANSTFTGIGGEPQPLPPIAKFEDPPFKLIVSSENPHRITGFSARVLDLKF